MLDAPMVLLHKIVEILALPHAHPARQNVRGLQFRHRTMRGDVSIRGDFAGHAILLQGLA
jgi:hypothetical protein